MRQGIAAALMWMLAGCGALGERSEAGPDSSPSPAHADPAQRQAWLEMFARSYFPGRSGQVFLVNREGDIITSREPLYAFMHGSPWDYDTRIPVLFWGPPFVRRGVWPVPAKQQDVAPTLGALIGAPSSATYTGHVLQETLAPGAARPRVAVVLVLDGMRTDMLDTYADVLPTLTRLRQEGAWFPEARIDVLPTVTGLGHATIGTGTDPRFHGIAGNNLFNRVTGKSQSSFDQHDPRELMALTLADIWGLATNGQALIIGQGGAMRATLGLVGHGGCLVNGRRVLAASYDPRTSGWQTNPSCFTLSEALGPLRARDVWDPEGDDRPEDYSANEKVFRASSRAQEFEGRALLAVLEHEALGADEVTDLVCVNLKGPDYVGHAWGPDSEQMRATLVELDQLLMRLLELLERKAGRDQSVLAITADHGMPGEPAPDRRHYLEDIGPLIDGRFDPGGPGILQSYDDPADAQMYVDTAHLQSLGFSLDDVADYLETLDWVAAAFTEGEVRAAQAALGGPPASPTR